MTTFQAIIYSIIHGLSEFLPISSKAHHILFPHLVGWQAPTPSLLAVLYLGSFLALLVFFLHDWASMISCFLQVAIYRKRPMTLDERLPLFLVITTLPLVLANSYFHPGFLEGDWTPLGVAGLFAAMGIPIWFFDYFGRKTKGMFDWKSTDALVVGLIQATSVVPGWDALSGLLMGALFLNYRREAAAKYAYFATAPILFSKTMTYLKEINFHSSAPAADLSWLSFGVALVVTFLVGLLALGGFMKHVQQNKGMGQYVVYRWILALGIGILYWVRGQA